jgi:hypothetical protein
MFQEENGAGDVVGGIGFRDCGLGARKSVSGSLVSRQIRTPPQRFLPIMVHPSPDHLQLHVYHPPSQVALLANATLLPSRSTRLRLIQLTSTPISILLSNHSCTLHLRPNNHQHPAYLHYTSHTPQSQSPSRVPPLLILTKPPRPAPGNAGLTLTHPSRSRYPDN